MCFRFGFVLNRFENQFVMRFDWLFARLLHEKIFLCYNLLILNNLSRILYLSGIFLVSFALNTLLNALNLAQVSYTRLGDRNSFNLISSSISRVVADTNLLLHGLMAVTLPNKIFLPSSLMKDFINPTQVTGSPLLQS